METRQTHKNLLDQNLKLFPRNMILAITSEILYCDGETYTYTYGALLVPWQEVVIPS